MRIPVLFEFRTTTTLGKIAKFLTTSDYRPPSWMFRRRWCHPLSVEVVCG